MDLMQLLQLLMFGHELQQNRRRDDREDEDAERARAALQRPSIIPWNFPNANGRRAMIVPGMFNEATGAYAPTETMWEDQYTSRTDDDDDDSLLDDYVNQ
jgi:hypothetical protein